MTTSSSFIMHGKNTPRVLLHTPTTYRAQRRLRFTTPSAQIGLSDLPPVPGVSPTLSPMQTPSTNIPALPMADNLSAQTPSTNIPALPMANNLSTSTPLDNSHEPPMRCLPWDTPGASITSLYKTKAPNLKYPSGSQDEAVNERFLKRMDF